MEYLVTANRPFEEIEALAMGALERRGLVVQRTFSLRSAVGTAGGNTSTLQGTASSPGYSVLMLYTPGTPRRPLGLIALYERGGRTVINPVLMPVENGQHASPIDSGKTASADLDAELVAALALSGLEFCAQVAKGEECTDTGASRRQGAASGRFIQDPV